MEFNLWHGYPPRHFFFFFCVCLFVSALVLLSTVFCNNWEDWLTVGNDFTTDGWFLNCWLIWGGVDDFWVVGLSGVGSNWLLDYLGWGHSGIMLLDRELVSAAKSSRMCGPPWCKTLFFTCNDKLQVQLWRIASNVTCNVAFII